MRPFPQLRGSEHRILNWLDSCCTSAAHIHQIQAQLILQSLHSNTTIAHRFIAACKPLGLLPSALLLFTQLRKPHVFICNSLIRAFSHSHSPHDSVFVYAHMHKNSILPNNFTFPFLLKSLSELKDLRQGQCVHTHITKLGHLNDIYVQNSLLSIYASCGCMGSCHQAFNEMPQKDVVSWTVLIAGNRSAGRHDDALIAFEQMQYAGVVPNRVTMVNALSTCSKCGALEMGVWIHDFIRRSGWELDVILGTSLVNMYGNCGRIEEGMDVFKNMKEKNVFTWNALIKGLALAKSGNEAVRWFSRMEHEGIEADEVTFLGVLCACSHSGLVQMGRRIFSSLIVGKYGFLPNFKHYACMIDLLVRAGRLQEAFIIITKLPFEPTKAMWGAFVAGSRTHGELELSEFATRKLVELEPENGAHYVLLSNLYAEMGRRSDVESMKRLMKETEMKKDQGCGAIEFEYERNVYELLAA
ncbi:pentatricopeptide repeat-containing protein At5g66520-like [Malania oleifera]|uniref:pentatricopeptide repeat-containing protein At5g66520-like n=1 Tax=Malania oleifera TaxID=397392 RepID=UPI0025ADF4E3|nr:pentatricopeptide repeat-containing protein At5g66520-like [Malania oleifera]